MTAQQGDMIDQILRNAPFDLGGDVAAQRPLLEGDAALDRIAASSRTTPPIRLPGFRVHGPFG